MKKWLIACAVLLTAAIAGVYFFIPKELKISQTVRVPVNSNIAYRCLLDDRNWSKWWPHHPQPATRTENQKTFLYNQTRYTLQQKLFDGYAIRLQQHNQQGTSLLQVLPAGNAEAFINWSYTVPAGSNPFQKISRYFQARSTRHDMAVVLENFRKFLLKEENVYGFKVSLEKVKDTVLVATRFVTDEYPSTAAIYEHIQLLRQYVARSGAAATNHPMLHVRTTSHQQYETMVGLPTSRFLEGAGKIEAKRMVPGNILMAQVKGGQATVEEGLKQLENYVSDNHLTSPAIPFALLVTDRTKEPDTTKWVTRIYYPIF